jgi:hypothetical protein
MSIIFKMSIEFMFSCLMHLYTKFEMRILPSLNLQTLPPYPLQSTSNHHLQNLQLHLVLQNEQDHKIIEIRKVIPSNNYLRQKRTPDQKHNKMKRRKTMICTYQWQATTARKTPQSPTTSMSYNNEKNTTKSTRMTRKSQRQLQWCIESRK